MNVKLKFSILAVLLATNRSAFAPPLSGTVLWTYDVPGLIYSAPAIGPDGTIYVGTGTTLFAVTNAGTSASNRWAFPSGTRGSPAVGSDGTIYFSNSGLVALNPDGSQKWSYPAGNGSPAIGSDNTVYVVGAGRLYAISSEGKSKWDYSIDYASATPANAPVISQDGTIYVGSQTVGAFYAINPDGTKKWSADDLGWCGESAAIGVGGAIYFTAGRLNNFSLYAYRADGSNLWSNASTNFSGASPVVGSDDVIYLANYATFGLSAISSSGNPIWQAIYAPNCSIGGCPPTTVPAIDAAGTIYYCVSNSVFALSSRGQAVWAVSYPLAPAPGQYVSTTSPIIGPDGTLYAALGGTLYAIATGTNGPANSPWPMYRQNARHTGKVEKPALQQPQKRSDAGFQFELYGQLGQTYTVESSTNLGTWTWLTGLVATTLPMDVVDLSASNFPARFYRASSPP